LTGKVAYIVAPDGQAGGGMGRVKDYIVESRHNGASGIRFEPLVTRDGRGFAVSIWLTIRAVLLIWWMRITGRLAFVHVNFGDRASAVRKGFIVIMSRAAGTRVVLHLHAVELHHQFAKGGPVLRLLIALPFRAATSVIVLGDVWRRWLTDEVGIPGDCIDIVFNGVPVSVPPPRSFAAGERAEMLFLGNLIERKGVTDLLEAVAALPADIPDWHLSLAGGGEIDRYRALAANLGIADRLTFVGWVDQAGARKLLLNADCLVLPSYDEGLPLVILEALGSATPVICTPVGAIPEALEDGRTALFCTPGDPAGLSARLVSIIRQPQLRKQLSDAGRVAYLDRFSAEAFLKSLFDVYRRRLSAPVSTGEEGVS